MGCTDYLQFTITSRVEMPNEEFVTEIERAAADLYALYFPGETVPKSRLISSLVQWYVEVKRYY